MALPVEVLERLEHTEDKLNPFYEHLVRMHDELRAKLKAGTDNVQFLTRGDHKS